MGEKMTKSKKAGRPTVMTEVVLAKLEEAYAWDCTDEEACFFAGIDPATLYRHQEKYPEFCDRKKALKQRPVLKARRTVVDALDDPHMALKYLERKKKDEFSPKVEVDRGKDDQIVIELIQYGAKGGTERKVIPVDPISPKQIEDAPRPVERCIEAE
jgi:hypothetical protein